MSLLGVGYDDVLCFWYGELVLKNQDIYFRIGQFFFCVCMHEKMVLGNNEVFYVYDIVTQATYHICQRKATLMLCLSIKFQYFIYEK